MLGEVTRVVVITIIRVCRFQFLDTLLRGGDKFFGSRFRARRRQLASQYRNPLLLASSGFYRRACHPFPTSDDITRGGATYLGALYWMRETRLNLLASAIISRSIEQARVDPRGVRWLAQMAAASLGVIAIELLDPCLVRRFIGHDES
jgi:hypothetical protein